MQEYIKKLIAETIGLIETNKSHGNDFNLLKISGMGSSEVFTHTPILKELIRSTWVTWSKRFIFKNIY